MTNTTPMPLHGPDDKCFGCYRDAGPKRGQLFAVCLRCARFDMQAPACIGTMTVDTSHGQRVPSCDSVLYDGSHGLEHEALQRVVTPPMSRGCTPNQQQTARALARVAA